ncbi:MAG: hypothetical protein GYA67_02005 [Smithella sp.]|mgnify:CR=1 FL=1|jgi:hypothetical protein|nr:hypothetical protein [Smithella sp.]OQC55886.1 MAG: hypothetical protein BWX51_02170 [Bacteroidetes bacterium ADurb.Bin012]HOU57066.1 hypothetical protein [Smithellaceae bacterium]HQB28699.1 hypothetical protein [Paludibacter sp.]HQJ78166.1 hypothetical protein [Smithellaceae bacterium]
MGAKEEVLAAAKIVIKSRGINEFAVGEVIQYMQKNKTKYKEPTIRSQIVSRCCVNSPKHHDDQYKYFKRIRKNTYKILEF